MRKPPSSILKEPGRSCPVPSGYSIGKSTPRPVGSSQSRIATRLSALPVPDARRVSEVDFKRNQECLAQGTQQSCEPWHHRGHGKSPRATLASAVPPLWNRQHHREGGLLLVIQLTGAGSEVCVAIIRRAESNHPLRNWVCLVEARSLSKYGHPVSRGTITSPPQAILSYPVDLIAENTR
jgi:hypothetical protein